MCFQLKTLLSQILGCSLGSGLPPEGLDSVTDSEERKGRNGTAGGRGGAEAVGRKDPEPEGMTSEQPGHTL